MNTKFKRSELMAAWDRVQALIAEYDYHQGGEGQAALAQKCRVSQPTISRLSREPPQRAGAGFIRLFEFSQQQDAGKPRPDPCANPELVSALSEVWNGTEEHASALAAIIRATGEAARAANNQR